MICSVESGFSELQTHNSRFLSPVPLPFQLLASTSQSTTARFQARWSTPLYYIIYQHLLTASRKVLTLSFTMAASSKPTIVIIGGAFHTPKSYGKLASALEASGFEVHVPRLPTCNEARPPNADLTDDTALIRGYVESLIEAGRTVVAIGHSYGGQVMTNALCGLGLEARSSQGLKGGVSKLVYMVGYALPEGMSTSDKFKEFGDPSNAALVFDIAEDHTMVLRNARLSMGLTGPGIDETDIESYGKTLCRWHGKAMMQPVEKTAWREIPMAYIHTTTDLSITIPEQESMVESVEKALGNTGRKVQTFTIESGHCPHFTATQQVVDVVNKVVSLTA